MATAASSMPQPKATFVVKKSAGGGLNTSFLTASPSAVDLKKIHDERQRLPIFTAKEALVEEVRDNENLIIVGETGSGKTTQLPQYLHEAGFTKHGMVGITQPRRVAAVTIAQRVAQENGDTLGKTVGYTVRFDDCSSKETKIKFLTDGMMLREVHHDSLLEGYSVIVLDEAHERTLHTDTLFALLKTIQKTRKEKHLHPLRIIVMSATLNAEKFSAYFSNAKIVYVSGRPYPVHTYFTKEGVSDYAEAAVTSVLQIHLSHEMPGDILVFLTGQEEIETVKKLLEEKTKQLPRDAPNLFVCAIYAALPPEQQFAVFEPAPAGTRKAILATNIAETSITINGIRYVVDTGMTKVRSFQAKTSMETLKVQAISKAEAFQRAGRSGRQAVGHCYRLYPERVFAELADNIQPEILRSNLTSVVLQLKGLGVANVLDFDFMDKPSKAAIRVALHHLLALGALQRENGALTEAGRKMLHFPVEPMYAKILLASAEEDFKCTRDVLSIIAALSVEAASLFFIPTDPKQRAAAQTIHRRFYSGYGDFITLLEVIQQYEQVGVKRRFEWCKEKYVNARSMTKVFQVRDQLEDICKRLKIWTPSPSSSAAAASSSLSGGGPAAKSSDQIDTIRRCFIKGLFLRAAKRQPDGTYTTFADNAVVNIHPTSVLFVSNRAGPPSATKNPFQESSSSSSTLTAAKQSSSALLAQHECVLYNELVVTSKPYIRDLLAIDMKWLYELVPQYFQESHLPSATGGSAAASSSDGDKSGGRMHLSATLEQTLSRLPESEHAEQRYKKKKGEFKRPWTASHTGGNGEPASKKPAVTKL